jgi:hypothetical protein
MRKNEKQQRKNIFSFWKKGKAPNIINWITYCDPKSTINLTRTKEIIDGRTEDCVTISGTMEEMNREARYLPWAGARCTTDDSTLNALRTMKSLSFKALGDGRDYYIRFPTFETMNGDHYVYVFPTMEDEVITVTVNIPGDLLQSGWSGKTFEFIQNNIINIQFETINSGPFNLKFWDIRLYK